jgi:galactitol-specific phosphotransferase system IIB component
MKKVFLSAVVVMTLAACGNGQNKDVAADSTVKDSIHHAISGPAVNNPDSAVKMVDSAKKMIDKADVKVSISMDSVDKK